MQNSLRNPNFCSSAQYVPFRSEQRMGYECNHFHFPWPCARSNSLAGAMRHGQSEEWRTRWVPTTSHHRRQMEPAADEGKARAICSPLMSWQQFLTPLMHDPPSFSLTHSLMFLILPFSSLFMSATPPSNITTVRPLLTYTNSALIMVRANRRHKDGVHGTRYKWKVQTRSCPWEAGIGQSHMLGG